MTLLNLMGLQSALGTPEPVTGTVSLRYVAGGRGFVEVDGEQVILPKTITVRIVAGEPVEALELQPTRGLCALEVRVQADGSGSYLQRAFALPDVTSIDIGDLDPVDPDTFLPLDPIPPNAQQILETAQTAVDVAEAQSLIAGGFAQDAAAALADLEGQKGEPGGLAVLGEDSVVPDENLPERLSTEGLSGTIATAPRSVYGRRGVVDGDSITIASTTASGGVRQDHGNSWVTPFFGHSMGAIEYVFNAAVSGQESADMLARFDTYVAPLAADWVNANIGTNDVGHGVPLATFIANMTAYYAKCVAVGKRLIVGAIWPTDSDTPSGRRATTRLFNDALYAWAAARDIDVIPWDRLADPATGGWPAGWTDDPTGVHPGAGDSYDRIGKFGYEFIAPKLGPRTLRRAVAAGDVEMTNGLMTATTTGPSAPTISADTPSTASGTLPAGAYSYRATSRTYWGETLPGAERISTLSGTGQISLTITGPANNRGRRLYRKGPGDTDWKLLAKLTASGNYVDDGSVTPTAEVIPTVDTSMILTGLIQNASTLHEARTHGPYLRTAAGVRGQVLRVAQYEGASGIYLDRFDVPVTAADHLYFSGLIQGSGGGTGALVLYFRSAAPATIGTLRVADGVFTQGFRLMQIDFVVPAGAVNMRVSIEGGAGSSWVDVAELMVKKL